MFLDRVEVFVAGGDGGRGSASMRREKYVPHGGPDGGDGGHGGSVELRVNPSIRSLYAYRYTHHFRAEPGSPGTRSRRHGRNGADVTLEVPPGTLVREKDTGRLIADLREGDAIVVAPGGRGGRGNVHFKNSVQQAPRFAELGEPGKDLWLVLELKLLADVGLVGLPNAGKSTLLGRLTAAKPKVGDYPFTTLDPEIGVLASGDDSCVLADLPGLIAGASEGKGLGFRFLKHVERCRLLLHVVDVGTQPAEAALEDIAALERELGAYLPGLLERPRFLVLSKCDLPGASEAAQKVAGVREDLPSLAVSAATGSGLGELSRAVLTKVKTLAPPPALPSEPEPQEELLAVERLPDGFAVRGDRVERRVAMTDLENEQAASRLAVFLRRSGVDDALRSAGAQPGDTVFIAGQTFHFLEDSSADRAQRRDRH